MQPRGCWLVVMFSCSAFMLLGTPYSRADDATAPKKIVIAVDAARHEAPDATAAAGGQ